MNSILNTSTPEPSTRFFYATYHDDDSIVQNVLDQLHTQCLMTDDILISNIHSWLNQRFFLNVDNTALAFDPYLTREEFERELFGDIEFTEPSPFTLLDNNGDYTNSNDDETDVSNKVEDIEFVLSERERDEDTVESDVITNNQTPSIERRIKRRRSDDDEKIKSSSSDEEDCDFSQTNQEVRDIIIIDEDTVESDVITTNQTSAERRIKRRRISDEDDLGHIPSSSNTTSRIPSRRTRRKGRASKQNEIQLSFDDFLRKDNEVLKFIQDFENGVHTSLIIRRQSQNILSDKDFNHMVCQLGKRSNDFCIKSKIGLCIHSMYMRYIAFSACGSCKHAKRKCDIGRPCAKCKRNGLVCKRVILHKN